MTQPKTTKEVDDFYFKIEEERGNIMTETKKGSTFIKHYYSHTFEDCPHYTAEITVDEDASLSDMCRAFELFLKVSGYEFDGFVDIVKDEDEPVHNYVPTGYVPKKGKMDTFDEKM